MTRAASWNKKGAHLGAFFLYIYNLIVVSINIKLVFQVCWRHFDDELQNNCCYCKIIHDTNSNEKIRYQVEWEDKVQDNQCNCCYFLSCCHLFGCEESFEKWNRFAEIEQKTEPAP